MLFIIKKFLYLFLVSYIKRRHFHWSSSKKDNFLIVYIFSNNILRKFLFFIANKFIKKKYSNKINYRLFVYQKSENIRSKEYPNNFLNDVDFNLETRKSFLTSTNDNLKFEINVLEDQYIILGFAILEDYFQIYKIEKFDVDIFVTIENKEKSKTLKLAFPVNEKKHGIAHIAKGKNWIDFTLDLGEFSNSKALISISFSLKNKTFLIFPQLNKEKKLSKKNVKKLNTNIRGIALSKPIHCYRNKKNENIIYISCESFTDPFLLEKISFSKNLAFNNIKKLLENSTYFEKTYSVADSTIPNIPSVLTGLSPMQHGFGNYQETIFNRQFNDDIKFLPELLKEKNFINTSYVAYQRFDPLHGFAKGMDIWNHSKSPWDDSAPSANKIINSLNFFKDKNLFLYTHLNRLHGPMLNNNHSETPSLLSAESISDAIDYKFNDLYADQLKNLDSQIGLIIGYLKSNNMYDQSTIIITGDHGMSYPPDWKPKALKFPQYELHSRTPLIIKYNKEINNHKPEVDNNPTSAQLRCFLEILKYQNINLPSYFNGIFQKKMVKEKIAISETIFHPSKNFYGISVIKENKKIYKLFNFDWENLKIKNIDYEKYFIFEDNGTIDEKKDTVFNKENFGTLNEQLDKIVSQNIEFNKKMESTRFPQTIKKII